MAFGLGITLYLKQLSYISAFIQKKNAIPVPSGCRLFQRVTAEEQEGAMLEQQPQKICCVSTETEALNLPVNWEAKKTNFDLKGLLEKQTVRKTSKII